MTTTMYLVNAQGNNDELRAFRNSLMGKSIINAKGQSSTGAVLDLPGKGLTRVEFSNHEQEGESESFSGTIENEPNSNVYLNFDATGLNGFAISGKDDKAFKYSARAGKVIVEQVDKNAVLCLNFNTHDEKANSGSRLEAAPSASGPINKLQSLPSAQAVAYLDFDGEVVRGTAWKNGATINAGSSGFSEATIREIFVLVSEDFRPFDINITTDRSVFEAAPKNRRMMCIFTPTNDAAPGAGGVAYLRSFTWNDNTPCWVFNRGAKGAGEAGSHEIGHTLGLRHDGLTSPRQGYYAGHGNWAPIMGVGYRRNIAQWSKGEYRNADQKEDDLRTIVSNNGFGYRNDDFGSSRSSASGLTINGNKVEVNGVIETSGDVDVFAFESTGGNVDLAFTPYGGPHANLDISAKLLNASGNEVVSSNPTGVGAAINKNLNPGKYYISLEGTGYGDPSTNGYSSYASIGAYTIAGTITNGTGGDNGNDGGDGGGDGNQLIKLSLKLRLDRYPKETSWNLKDATGKVVASGNNYRSAGILINKEFDLPKGCYDFEIKDSYGDGICCAYGNGSYELSADGKVLASGGSFRASETKKVCVGGDTPPKPTMVTLAMVMDNYPEEISWTLQDGSGKAYGTGKDYSNRGQSVEKVFELPSGCYRFIIKDVYGDGMCCRYGNGSYMLRDENGKVLASGGDFRSTDTKDFCVGDASSKAEVASTLEELETEGEASVLIYPNPTLDELNISVKEMRRSKFSVLSTTGVEIMSGKLNGEAKISVRSLRSGTYILKVYNNEEVKIKRFIKK